MKTTKHIEKLAQNIFKNEEHTSIEYIERELNNVKIALLTGRYYTRVESVSQSNMSRIISIKYIKNNVLHNVSDFVYKLAGCDVNHRIGGCGMDMLFAAQYNLFVTLIDSKRTFQYKMKRYNSL